MYFKLKFKLNFFSIESGPCSSTSLSSEGSAAEYSWGCSLATKAPSKSSAPSSPVIVVAALVVVVVAVVAVVFVAVVVD